ncbi:MAG: hypothetical protein JXR22_06555 [Prolixibacteraceae bacterium]|nr:hypothetical protein [Prolixibacteraceae bacterium]
MKTQLLTFAFAMMISINGLFAENKHLNATPDQVSINELAVETSFETGLDIKDWMTNDEQWNKQVDLPLIDTTVEEEASLEIEPWMTDSKQWQAKPAVTCTTNTININGIEYKIYNYNNDKELPLSIEAWMVSDRMWKRYQYENAFAQHE